MHSLEGSPVAAAARPVVSAPEWGAGAPNLRSDAANLVLQEPSALPARVLVREPGADLAAVPAAAMSSLEGSPVAAAARPVVPAPEWGAGAPNLRSDAANLGLQEPSALPARVLVREPGADLAAGTAAAMHSLEGSPVAAA